MPRVPPKWNIVEFEYKSNLGSGTYKRVITRDSPSLFWVPFGLSQILDWWNRLCFAFLLADPPYMALIFGKKAVFDEMILRGSFDDPSLYLFSRCPSIFGGMLSGVFFG